MGSGAARIASGGRGRDARRGRSGVGAVVDVGVADVSATATGSAGATTIVRTESGAELGSAGRTFDPATPSSNAT
ncbi:MAG TPA: hypothetical protein VFF43_01705 [Caldimonas sp.]|nr:hypothetical protein [Caldimonas sp.]